MHTAQRTVLRAAAVIGLCFALTACNSKPAPRPGGATGGKADEARRAAEKLVTESVTAGADAQGEAIPALKVTRPGFTVFGSKPVLPRDGKPPAPVIAPDPIAKGPPAPESNPRPGSGPLVVRERVVSALPHTIQADAEEDAVELARELVEQKLAELDPPVRRKVTLNEVRTEYLRNDSRKPRPPKPEEEKLFAGYEGLKAMWFVEYDVEVSADQVRELRAQERVTGAFRVLGMLVAVALAGFLFLRADEWTRGYLTSWLALAAAALAGGIAAALIFV